MILVDDIIQQAFSRLGLVGDTKNADGVKAQKGVQELNWLIHLINQQNYISDNMVAKEYTGSSIITIGDSENYNVMIDEPPSYIDTLMVKEGNHYRRLFKGDSNTVYSRHSSGKPYSYTYDVKYDPIEDTMCGIITLDGTGVETFKIIFTGDIPEVALGDTLHIQKSYKSMLIAGLAWRLAKRYKLMDQIASMKEDFDDAIDAIKTVNANNRPMTWNDGTGDYMDSYYAGLNGSRDW